MLEVFLHLIYNQRCRIYNTMNDSKTLEFLRYKLGLRNSKYNICASLFFFCLQSFSLIFREVKLRSVEESICTNYSRWEVLILDVGTFIDMDNDIEKTFEFPLLPKEFIFTNQ
jgi:hypothetical protein